MKFEFMTANRIIFERGSISRIGKLAKEFGTKVLLSTGMSPEATDKVVKLLKDEGLEVVVVVVTKEPSIENLEVSLAVARKEKCDVVVGFGGGSAMDTGKIISAMMDNPGEVLDYLEVIGKGMTLVNPSIPCIAVPTTSGTGAEVTKNSVLGSITNKVKVSLRSPFLLPKIVLLDPEMTISVPPSVTASTGLDALTQVIEPFVSNAANPFTDAFCREGMKRASESLRKAFDDGSDIDARVNMSLASLMGGLALANAKLGAVHGFAGVLGGMYPIPHGVVCATLLPYTIKTNVEALSARLPASEYLKRFDEVGQILTGNLNANARDAVNWIQDLCTHLNVPRLSAFGITEKEFPEIVEKSKVASSMKGNPIVLTDEELFAILKSAL